MYMTCSEDAMIKTDYIRWNFLLEKPTVKYTWECDDVISNVKLYSRIDETYNQLIDNNCIPYMPKI